MQAVHRKIAKLGLASDYAEDTNIRECCRELMALSLMPVSEVEKQFQRMRALAPSSLDDLFIYFERQWVKGNISLSLWNVNDSDDRTNNTSEGNKDSLHIRIDK
jgi:hypothetical protein